MLGFYPEKIPYIKDVIDVIYKKEAIQIENVQRRATKLVKNIQHLSYIERLKYIRLPSLQVQYRRLRAYMVETFKILNNIDKVQHEHIFPISRTATRGHNQKIYKKNCRTNIRKYSFSQRIVDMWNSLPKQKQSTLQKPIKQPLEKSGDNILTRCLLTGGRIQLTKRGPRG